MKLPGSLRSDALREACLKAGISVSDARSSSQRRDLVARRNHVMAILRARQWSLPVIGRAINRHHATVLHGLRRHEAVMKEAANAR